MKFNLINLHEYLRLINPISDELTFLFFYRDTYPNVGIHCGNFIIYLIFCDLNVFLFSVLTINYFFIIFYNIISNYYYYIIIQDVVKQLILKVEEATDVEELLEVEV